jgi:hypothetical protein
VSEDSSADHDHSGDHLGREEHVESITANRMHMRQFAAPGSFLVFPEGDEWRALRTADGTVPFADGDGGAVVDDALAALGAGEDGGTVRVTGRGRTTLETDTTIEHTTDGTGLAIDPGVRLEYTGGDSALVLAGDGIGFEFFRIDAPDARAVIRDLGLTNAAVRGTYIEGGTESLWLSDADYQLHRAPSTAGTTMVHFGWGIPGGRYGIKLTSAPDARFAGYRFRTPVLFGGSEITVVFGDRSDADSVNDCVFYGDVDAGFGGHTLVEVNDSHNAVYLKDFIPTARGEVAVAPEATDTTVLPLTVRGMELERTNVATTDLSKFDQFKGEVMRFEYLPDSLAGYAVERRGSGAIKLSSGHVAQDTGKQPDSWASVHRRVSNDANRLRFDNAATFQTNVRLHDNTNQEAWLLWGSRDGPGVGWHVRDDVLQGWVHDGSTASTVPLRTGFEPGAAWNLTAFYSPPSVYYAVAETTVARSDDGPRRGQSDAVSSVGGEVTVAASAPAELDGHLSVERTGNATGPAANQVMSISLTNNGPEAKRLQWSTWRNHVYSEFFTT